MREKCKMFVITTIITTIRGCTLKSNFRLQRHHGLSRTLYQLFCFAFFLLRSIVIALVSKFESKNAS